MIPPTRTPPIIPQIIPVIRDRDAGDETPAVRTDRVRFIHPDGSHLHSETPSRHNKMVWSDQQVRDAELAGKVFEIIDTDYRLSHMLSIAQQRAPGGIVISHENGRFSAAVMTDQIISGENEGTLDHGNA